MNILGLNAYHGDSSACIVSDGKLVCAIEEERIRRIKHWAGLPSESIKWCLEYAGLDIIDLLRNCHVVRNGEQALRTNAEQRDRIQYKSFNPPLWG